MASAAASGTSTLGLTSILPPRCIAKTGSFPRDGGGGKLEKIAWSATVNPQSSGAAGDMSAVLRVCGGGFAPAAQPHRRSSLQVRGLPVDLLCHEELAGSAVSAIL